MHPRNHILDGVTSPTGKGALFGDCLAIQKHCKSNSIQSISQQKNLQWDQLQFMQ